MNRLIIASVFIYMTNKKDKRKEKYFALTHIYDYVQMKKENPLSIAEVF